MDTYSRQGIAFLVHNVSEKTNTCTVIDFATDIIIFYLIFYLMSKLKRYGNEPMDKEFTGLVMLLTILKQVGSQNDGMAFWRQSYSCST